jgi:hypothetical protein
MRARQIIQRPPIRSDSGAILHIIFVIAVWRAEEAESACAYYGTEKDSGSGL